MTVTPIYDVIKLDATTLKQKLLAATIKPKLVATTLKQNVRPSSIQYKVDTPTFRTPIGFNYTLAPHITSKFSVPAAITKPIRNFTRVNVTPKNFTMAAVKTTVTMVRAKTAHPITHPTSYPTKLTTKLATKLTTKLTTKLAIKLTTKLPIKLPARFPNTHPITYPTTYSTPYPTFYETSELTSETTFETTSNFNVTNSELSDSVYNDIHGIFAILLIFFVIILAFFIAATIYFVFQCRSKTACPRSSRIKSRSEPVYDRLSKKSALPVSFVINPTVNTNSLSSNGSPHDASRQKSASSRRRKRK